MQECGSSAHIVPRRAIRGVFSPAIASMRATRATDLIRQLSEARTSSPTGNPPAGIRDGPLRPAFEVAEPHLTRELELRAGCPCYQYQSQYEYNQYSMPHGSDHCIRGVWKRNGALGVVAEARRRGFDRMANEIHRRPEFREIIPRSQPG